MPINEVVLTGESLTLDEIHAVCRGTAKVKLSEKAKQAVIANRLVLEDMIKSGTAIYGVTTGIGEFARIQISPEQGEELQKRIVYSHAAAVGDPIPESDVRVALLLRANTLANGNSAVRLQIVDTLIEMLNKRVHPVIYQKGSLGTSGDLAPLSMMAEVVMGEGRADYNGKRMTGGEAMKSAGIPAQKLSFKEGLGLINGTEAFSGVGLLAIYDSIRVIKTALIAVAMTLDTVGSNMSGLDPRAHAIRKQRGQIVAAENLRRLLEGSQTIPANKGKVQDAYSLRCAPQIIGPTLDALQYCTDIHLREANGVCDNPLFFTQEKDYVAAGNFHGQAVAMAQDFLAIAISEIASISERHTNRLLNPTLSGLPDFLVEGKGLNSGLMVSQYSAAALVSENKLLSHPGVVDSISVSADQEDHVCMGGLTAWKLTQVIRNTEIVVGIQLLCAAQALDFRRPLKGGRGSEIAYNIIRKNVSRLIDDRPLYPDMDKLTEIVRGGLIVTSVEDEIGELKL